MADAIPPNNKSKIIAVPTGDNPDGPHGICWRSIGSQVILAQVNHPGVLSGQPVQTQPIKISTEVPCIGARCHAWDAVLNRCAFVAEAQYTIQDRMKPHPIEGVRPYLEAVLSYFKIKLPKADAQPVYDPLGIQIRRPGKDFPK